MFTLQSGQHKASLLNIGLPYSYDANQKENYIDRWPRSQIFFITERAIIGQTALRHETYA